jgi:hypothetical protein
VENLKETTRSENLKNRKTWTRAKHGWLSSTNIKRRHTHQRSH